MKLGFITACLPGRTLPQLCEWAAAEGYEALEVAAWPDLGDRPFTATHLAVESFGPAEADATRALFAKHGLELSSLAFYDNNLHPDPAERRRHQRPPRPGASRRRPWWGARRSARSSAATRAGRWPRTCATPRPSSARSSTGPASWASSSSSRTA